MVDESVDESVAQFKFQNPQQWAALKASLFNGDLPIHQQQDALIKAIKQHQVVIVAGATGSGKTTQMPKFALLAGCGRRKKIAHTQPRRIAAVSAAKRLSSELAHIDPELVGYQVRFNSTASTINGLAGDDSIYGSQFNNVLKGGKLNALDSNFSKLKIWRDANQNGITDAGELKTLSDWKITELNVQRGQRYEQNRNQIDPAGTFTINGKSQQMADVWFARDPFHNQFTDTLAINATAKALPNISGMGAVRSF